MRKTSIILIGTLLSWFITRSQQTSGSSQMLSEVIVKAYEQNQSIKKIPAPIIQINKPALDRFNNTNILPAVNLY